MKNFKIGWLVITVVVSMFFVSGRFVDYYRFKLTGALYEIAWLPFLVLLFLIPVYSLYSILRKGAQAKIWFAISLVVSLVTIGWLVWAG